MFFLACGGYVILNILIRTIFNHPLTGVYEMTGLFAVVFASCSLVICIIEDGNVLVDVVIDKMGAKGRLFFKYFAHMIDLLYYAVLAWGAWRIGIAKLLYDLFYKMIGRFRGGLAMMILTLPVLLPIVSALNFDLVWSGVFMTASIQLANITPPVGMNLFVTKGLDERISMKMMYKGMWPYVIALIALVVVMAFWPEMVLWLPGMSA